MTYGIDQREADEMTRIVNCDNLLEKCPACPRWNKDCDGLDEYNEMLENVDCSWRMP